VPKKEAAVCLVGCKRFHYTETASCLSRKIGPHRPICSGGQRGGRDAGNPVGPHGNRARVLVIPRSATILAANADRSDSSKQRDSAITNDLTVMRIEVGREGLSVLEAS
jgi:hypothetical protein